jgi:CubicO group peptidase (beta-lactamase class C family)
VLALCPHGLVAQDFASDVTSRVDALFARFDAADSPGCVVGITRSGELLYERGYGLANLESRASLTAETPVYVASLAKQFLAASVLLAERRGHLSLDDDIRTHVPEMPQYDAPISIRQLIHHTSGIRDMYTLGWLRHLEEVSQPEEEEALSLLTRQAELNFTPGTAVAYTTSNYELLGHILSRATGVPHWEFAQAELFGPLGMNSTELHHGDVHGATGYHGVTAGAVEPVDVDRGRGAYSSLRDLLLWDMNLSESHIGGPDFSRKLVTPGALENGESHQYAFGLVIGEHRGLRTVAHSGAWTGFRSAYLRFPDQAFSVVCLCNTDQVSPGRLASRIADIYLAEEFVEQDPWVPDLTPGELEAFVGTYANFMGRILPVEVREASLAFVGPTRENRLVPVSGTRFRSPSFGDNEYQFSREGPDAPWRFTVFPKIAGFMPSRSMVFQRVELVSPTRAMLETLTGTYESPEAHATFKIELGEEALLLVRDGNLPALPLEPMAADTFVQLDKGITIVFERNERSRVIGFRLEAAGVWALRFTRRD